MAIPAEVQLKPGWLQDDVRRAQSRLSEWNARGGRSGSGAVSDTSRTPGDASSTPSLDASGHQDKGHRHSGH